MSFHPYDIIPPDECPDCGKPGDVIDSIASPSTIRYDCGSIYDALAGRIMQSDMCKRAHAPNIMTHPHELIARSIYEIISGFRVATGQTPYPPYAESPHQQMMMDAITMIDNTPNITPEAVHDYWMSWAQEHDPFHALLVPFEQMPPFEKMKDKLVIDIVRMFRKYE